MNLEKSQLKQKSFGLAPTVKLAVSGLILLALGQSCPAGILVAVNSNTYSYSIATSPGSLPGHPGIPFYDDGISPASGGPGSFTHNETTGTLTSTDPAYVFSESLTNNVTATLGADGTYSLALHELNTFTGTQATATAYANLINTTYAGKQPISSFSQGFQLTTNVAQQYIIQGTDSQTGLSPIADVEILQDGSSFAAFGVGSFDQTVTLLPGHTYTVQVLGLDSNDAFAGRNDGITSTSLDMNLTMTPVAVAGATAPEPSGAVITLLGLPLLAMLRRRRRSSASQRAMADK